MISKLLFSNIAGCLALTAVTLTEDHGTFENHSSDLVFTESQLDFTETLWV